MKKLLAVLITICLLITLAGCSAKSSNMMDSAHEAYPSVAPSFQEEAKESGVAQDMEAPESVSVGKLKSDRKIIKNTEIIMESREFDKSLEQINALIDQLDGYVESSNMSGISLYNTSVNSRNAYITARIPSEKLSGAAAQLDAIGNILSKTEGAEDITDVYYDVDARLRMLKIQEERYLELLKKTDKMEDILTLERALTEVRYEIENLTSQQKRFDQQVSYSYLRIELREVGDYSVVRNQPLSFGQRISNSFKDSLLFISRSAQNVVVYLVAVLPVLVVYGVVIGLIVWVIIVLTKRFNKNKNKAHPPQNKSQDEN